MRAAVIALLTWSVAAAVATAQEPNVQFSAGGGFAATAGPIEDRFGSGGQLEAGVTFLSRAAVGLRVDYGYTTLDGRDVEIPIAHVWGPRLPSIAPRITGADSATKANGQFLPVTVGVRW